MPAHAVAPVVTHGTAAAAKYDGSIEPAVAYVDRVESLAGALGAIGLEAPRPTLVLVGGAGSIGQEELARLEPLFAELVLAAERLDAAVVDGGTDSGVMRLVGRARAERAAPFPLVGVAAEALVAPPGSIPAAQRAALEPHHSHFVLVPGERWGDETPWLARVAEVLAGDCPSLTLLVNGGEISLNDVAQSVEATRPVLAIAGSGRAADDLAAALRGAPAGGPARVLAASGLVRAVELEEDSGRAVIDQLAKILTSGGGQRCAGTSTERR